MRTTSLLPVALATLATSNPILPRAPETSSARAFSLVANQTTNGPYHGRSVNTLPLGSSPILILGPGPGDGPDAARVFYLNGTTEQQESRQTHVLTDMGLPLSPYGLNVVQEASPTGAHGVTIVAGSGQEMTIEKAYGPRLANKTPGVFVACDQYVRPVNARLSVVGYVLGRMAIPAGCEIIELRPQCAELGELPEGSESSHDHALTVPCFNDV